MEKAKHVNNKAFNEFIRSIKNIPFFKPDGKPLREWKMFYGGTWDAARDAARDAAWA